MPNANYQAGVRFERERQKVYEELGYEVTRSAGSHGPWDLTAACRRRGTILIQCKYVEDPKEVVPLLRAHRQKQPYKGVHFRIEVRVKGSMEVHAVTI